MKDCAHAVRGDPHTKFTTLTDLRATSHQQGLDVGPVDAGLHWIGKIAPKVL